MQKTHRPLRLWVKKYLKYQTVLVLLFVVFFVFVQKIKAESVQLIKKGDIVINELMWMGMGEDSDDEWIEIKNTTSHAIDLTDVYIKNGGSGTSGIAIPAGNTISANGYFIIAKRAKENSAARLLFEGAEINWLQMSKLSLLDGGEELVLRTRDGLEGDDIDVVWKNAKWPKGENPSKSERLNGKIKKSMERNAVISDGTEETSWYTCISEDVETNNCATPGAKNSEVIEEKKDEEKVVESKIYPKNISITELFPNPFKSQYEEYVELYNGTAEAVDLKGWQLHDASKTGKYIFPESVILKAKTFLAVFKKDFKFALNNSGSERVTLFDPNGDEVSKVEYSGSKKNVSYNFDGNRWRWSKFLTPGAENILNNEPTGKVKKDDDIFENVFANFSVSTGDTDGDKVKVVWDFGDGHKSYLAKTRHKYQKVGTYQASVKLSDGSEDVSKNFSVEVEEFPHPKIRIVGFVANPEGSDTIGEKLIVENKSKKKVDLIGWSVATGSKKLVNHPITESFVLKKKETKELTREFSKFSLNNKEGKIELRYPDGKVADKIKYTKKTGIEEGERYVKTKDVWSWETSQTTIKSVKSIKQEEAAPSVIGNQSSNSETNIEEENVDGEVAGVEIGKKEIEMFRKNDLKNIKFSEIQFFSIGIVRIIDGQYFFTHQNKIPDHYAIVFLKEIVEKINININMLLNNIFER